MKSLSLDEAIGQLICPTLFGGPLAGQAFRLDQAVEDLQRHQWGGYILFHGTQEMVRSSIAALQAASELPLLVAADLEHGAGQHVSGLSVFPSAMAIGAVGDPQLAYQTGAWTAHEALSVGINWVFAPVADVNANPLNPIINVRSFGGDAKGVARMVEAFVQGVQGQGALACAKHFPGHGDTGLDSHSQLAVVEADRLRLEAVEWPPFRAAIQAEVASLMTAHLALPRLGVTGPATLDRRIMTDLLRGEWGFSGLLVTDALVMGGITKTASREEAAVRAMLAGCDMLLMPPDPLAAREALLRAVREGRLTETRVYEAAGRVLAAKQKIYPSAQSPEGDPRQLAEAIANRAVTLARGTPPPNFGGYLVVDDGAEPDRLARFEQMMAERGVGEGGEPLLVAVFSPIRVSKDRSLLSAVQLEQVRARIQGRRYSVVSFGSPFLVSQFPEADAWVLAYGSQFGQLEAAVAALWGEHPFWGHCPVALPPTLGDVSETAPHRQDGPSFA